MSLNTRLQVRNENEQEVGAPNSRGTTTPESEVTPAVAGLRQKILTESRCELLLALGEESREYQGMMESLREDLQPRRGLERHLMEEMGEMF